MSHWVSDAIQPSHPLSSPSPSPFNLSQHQNLFQWVSSSHQVAKILELQLQHQSFQSINSSALSLFYCPALYWKNHSFDYMDLYRQSNVSGFLICCLGFSLLFFQGTSIFLISWLQSPAAVILEPLKIKSLTVSIVSPFICHQVMGPDAMTLVFWCRVLNQLFHSPLSLSSRGSLVPLHFLP